MSLIKHILDKNLTEANESLKSSLSQIVEKKMWEMKKAISAKMECWSADGAAPRPEDPHSRRMRKLDTGVLEEDDPLEKNLPPISADNSASPERLNKLASMVRSQPGKAAPPTKSDYEKGANLEEARIKLIKARIRGGKIQRRKKISNVPGMRLQGGQLTRMTAAERRARRMGAKRAKIKRKAHMTQTLMRRKRSLVKRQRLGL